MHRAVAYFCNAFIEFYEREKSVFIICGNTFFVLFCFDFC